MSVQTVQTQIRLLPEEQSDQGLHCLLFYHNILDNFYQVVKHMYDTVVAHGGAIFWVKTWNIVLLQMIKQ